MEFDELVGDVDLEEKGRWFDVPPQMELKVASSASKPARKMMEKLLRPHARRRSSIPVEIIDDISRQVLAKFCVKDWKGIEREGKDYPYTQENCVFLLNNSTIFFEIVRSLSDDSSGYVMSEKNLLSSSNGQEK